MKYLLLLLFFGFGFWLSSCEPKDERIDPSPKNRLAFDRDTIQFDTVFEGTSSVTKRLWVYNRNSRAVEIERIELKKRSGNQYKLIINGIKSDGLNKVKLRGDDSLMVLVEVTVNPQTEQNFLVTDAIHFRTNGNIDSVSLVATGQKAHYYILDTLQCGVNNVWRNDLPHVVFGYVLVPPGCTLTIEKGVKVYFYNGSGIVVDGTLQILGEPSERVELRGYRREGRFENRPGQWYGLVIRNRSRGDDNEFRYADIKNGIVGIDIGLNDDDTDFDLKLEGCVIKNMLDKGIQSFSAEIQATNTIITNCGTQLVAGLAGGRYDFRHCTLYNGSGFFDHEDASTFFQVSTKLDSAGFAVYYSGNLDLRLTNSIIWGTAEEEFIIDTAQVGGSYDFNLLADHNIVRTERHAARLRASSPQVYSNQVISKSSSFNEKTNYPRFRTTSFPRLDLRLDSTRTSAGTYFSPAVDAGRDLGISTDLAGAARPDALGGLPDLGAYETNKQP